MRLIHPDVFAHENLPAVEEEDGNENPVVEDAVSQAATLNNADGLGQESPQDDNGSPGGVGSRGTVTANYVHFRKVLK